MSTIVCIKDAGRIVLGADSRTMTHDFSAIDSDGREKVIELAPGLFFAESGWVPLGDVLIGLARTIAKEHVSDIRLLAAALTEAAGPFLREFAGILSELRNPHQRVTETLTGANPLQGFLLAGRSGGTLGYVYYEFYIRDGFIVLKPKEYFGDARQIEVTNGAPIAHLSQDMRTWTDDPLTVVRRFLAEQRARNPHIGGPDQIVTINGKGARWVSRLPAAEAGAILAHSTISASVTLTAPTLQINAGSYTVRIDSTNVVKVELGSVFTQLLGDLVQVLSASGARSRMDLEGFFVTNTSSIAVAQLTNSGSGRLLLFTGNGASLAELNANGVFRCDLLPSANPGAGTKRFWYDPLDGNRVKFAA